MSNYHDMRDAKVNIANELRKRGWEILGYKEDESDLMIDYYSPADWDGIAKKNGFILCVDTRYKEERKPIIKYNYNGCMSQSDYKKIEKLKALTQERGATAGEETNAKALIEKIKNSNSDTPKEEIIGYTTAHMENPGRCNWHIEKDNNLYDKGMGIIKYSRLPWYFDISTMKFQSRQKRELKESEKKLINNFKSLILRWERVVNSINGMGDGTKETERKGKEQQQNEKMKKVIKKIRKKVLKMVEVKRNNFKVGDFLTLPYHGHYWKITSEFNRKGTWNGVKEDRKAFDYEIVGSASRGYKSLKNPKRYYNYEYTMLKSLKEGKIKIFELKEVEEVQEVEKWIKVKSQKKNTYKKKEDLKQDKQTQNNNVNNSESKININVEIKFNRDKNGIELHFDGKPSQEIREQIKSQGFRWSRYQKIWFCKDTQERREFLKEIGFLNDKKEQISISEVEKNIKEVEYPEIDINDIESYTVLKDLSDRENNISMFRSHNTDHTKILQETLKSANNDVLELIKKGCTPYIEYKAKAIVQSFKKNYTDAYISVLEHRSNNPSWAVTGRGGLNVRRYNKKQEQLYNKEQKTSKLIDKFNYKINKLKNQIIKNKKEQFENNLNSITDIPKFTHKKITINGEANANIYNLENASYTRNVTAHQYNNYSIIKNWGTFRIYNLKGFEVDSIKTNENLDVAKKHVMYLLQNQEQKEKVI